MFKKINIFETFIPFRNYSDSKIQKAKPYSEIPTLSILKFVLRNLPGGKYYKKSLSEIQKSFYNEFGRIFKMPAMFGKSEIIFIYKADDFETTFRAEGPWPNHLNLETLKYYRETKQSEIYGKYASLSTGEGLKWQITRSIVNPIMMQPKIVNIYTQQFDEIAKEFIQIMKKLKNNRSEMPKDFFQYLTKWSLETIATVSIEKRLNIFNGKTDDERSKKYMEVSAQFFDKLTDFELMPSIWKYYQTKYFKELMNVYDTMAKITFSYIEEAIKKFETERFKEVQEESILRKLLKINKQIAFVIAGDILMPDMVAAATNFTLYFLAKNLEKQEKLRSEVMKILPNKNSSIEPKSLQNMPYLKAVIKESLRLQPIVSGNSRELAKDVVLAGYHVPKGTMIFMNAYIELSNPKYYPNPEKFIPERWLRDQQNENWKSKEYNAFSYLPFGFGSRSCIGKRFAELQMEILIANVIRNFKLEWNYPDIKIKEKIENFPDSEMKFKVTEI